MELHELTNYLDEEVRARPASKAGIDGPEDAFTDVMLEYLSKGNELDAWEIGYAKRPGRKNAPACKINAWNLDGGENESSAPTVDLFVSIYKPGATGQSVTKSEVAEHFELARSFLAQSLTGFGGKLHLMEESAPPYPAAQTIHASRESLDTARIFLLTNGVVKQFSEKDVDVGGVEVKHFLWDLEKLRRLLSSGEAREAIEIDLAKDYGGPVPCLAQDDGMGEYTAYLAFFPASLLANIYGDYGPRLLEKNVRSYLQARGKVNKGIQTTIRDTPHRFLAYNNGISATAETVKMSRARDGLCRLELLRDFQIVNGGQTTASIYHALKKEKADISMVTVQVKLTVVSDAQKVAEFVPLISQYANSQNKVNVADFSANDAWHQKLEALSRSVWAPAATGTAKLTHWYYERARGSHLDDRARAGTPAKQKAWEIENPMTQKFTKTDVAKFDHSWDQKPYQVSKGAEKNFIEWTLARQRTGTALPEQGDFQMLVAKGILFRAAEKIVSKLDQGGYRANVVAYSLAWLSRETNGRLNLMKIWQKQGASPQLSSAIGIIATAAFQYLTETAGTRNVTEWAKKQECWDGFRTTRIDLPDISADLEKGEAKSGQKGSVEVVDTGGKSWQELYATVQKMKTEVWNSLAVWGRQSGELAPWQATLCSNFHNKLAREKKPTSIECKAALEILEVARAKGFTQ